MVALLQRRYSAPPPAFLSLHSPSRTRRGRRPRRPVLLSAMLPVRGVPRPRARFFRCPPSRTRRGRRPRRPASCSFAKGIFRAPARHPFAHGGKRMQKRRQKPMVFGIPFVRLQLRCKKVPQRIASAPTLAAADMARREQWSPSRLGDYQIAHLPPLAASVGAARRAAETIKFWTSA